MSDPSPISRFWRRHGPGYLFAGPYLVGLAALLAGPLVLSFALSLTHWDGMGGLDSMRWAGLDNYRKALSGQDEFFTISLANSAVYAAWAVPLGLFASLGPAGSLHRVRKSVVVGKRVDLRWCRIIIKKNSSMH